jgi:hypothetical protein
MVMHRPSSAATLVAPLLAFVGTSLAGTPESLEKARALLASDDARAAVAVLESALPAAAAPERPAILDQLRRAYDLAARQAEADGRAREAENYRENLHILDRKPARAEAPKQPPAPAAEVPHREVPNDEPEPAPVAAPEPQRVEEPSPAPEPRTQPVADGVASELRAADTAFRDRRYEEAGRLYGAMARDGHLPASRREHWAYCRCAEVVRRINANPRTAADWSSIHAEIREIRALSPANWYGEYLRNLANERAAGSARAPAKEKAGDRRQVVVRGSAPEEDSAPLLAPKPATSSPATPSPTQPVRPPATPSVAAQAGPAVGNWQVLMTTNFRILHADPALAQRVAKAAEAARDEQVRRWSPPGGRNPWAPRCDIYLYPTAALFSRMTGQPEDSPGFSTMGLNAGRVVARRVNLRADHAKLHAAVPHEVTHVVLADLFTNQQIPRWADEGLAVLAEPPAEQHLRAADLTEPLESGRIFKVADLMAADYPEGKFWGLYYAQSVSLTRFLVEQGTPAQFIQFLQGAQRTGPEPQLRQVYKIDGFADLQRRWLAYARSAPAVANASEEASSNATRSRR